MKTSIAALSVLILAAQAAMDLAMMKNVKQHSIQSHGDLAMMKNVKQHSIQSHGDLAMMKNVKQHSIQSHGGFHRPADCCFSYTPRKIQCVNMKDYTLTTSECSKPAVIFLTKKGQRVCEGMELYFLVVRVFQGQGLRKRWLCLIGYGVPLVIVVISAIFAATYKEGYGNALYCWLSHKHGFHWSFQGPVTFIVLCNAVIFVTTVWKLTQKFSEINPDIKKLKKARVLTITAIAQLFVLGCTWVFGLLLFDPRSWVLSYIFTILNCLQGFFLFLLYCLLNKKVREEYRKWACMVTRNKYSEFATTTSASSSSHSQTRALRPSQSGM